MYGLRVLTFCRECSGIVVDLRVARRMSWKHVHTLQHSLVLLISVSTMRRYRFAGGCDMM